MLSGMTEHSGDVAKCEEGVKRRETQGGKYHRPNESTRRMEFERATRLEEMRGKKKTTGDGHLPG